LTYDSDLDRLEQGEPTSRTCGFWRVRNETNQWDEADYRMNILFTLRTKEIFSVPVQGGVEKFHFVTFANVPSIHSNF